MIVVRMESFHKGKQKIYLDDGVCFLLYQKEVEKYGLKEDEEFSEEQCEEIFREILSPRAKKRAMYLLEKMDRTEVQLREKLQQNLYPVEIIEDAITYVKKYHYIDDFRYACNYIRYRKDSKSKRQLLLELHQKGVSKRLIEQALEEEYDAENEEYKIRRWLEKKNYDTTNTDVKERQKIYQFLLRKGFQSDDILRFL